MENPSVKLIVGLGNPGDSYRRHRHNLGFMVADELARRLGIVFRPGGPDYDLAEVGRPPGRVVVLKPMTFMNLSGRAVTSWARHAGVPVTGRASDPPDDGAGNAHPEEGAVRPLVVCDDLSLPLGSVRLRPRGSSGGQNGLASVIQEVGGEEFPRLRLGIAPRDREIDPAAWPEHVLADFDPGEEEAAADLVEQAAAALEFWLEHGLEPTISRFNRRVRPESGD